MKIKTQNYTFFHNLTSKAAMRMYEFLEVARLVNEELYLKRWP